MSKILVNEIVKSYCENPNYPASIIYVEIVSFFSVYLRRPINA